MNLPAIISEITQMAVVDQEMRKKAENDFKLWDATIDIANTARMKEIVEQIGWPTISKVGEETASAAWLLVQHADHDVVFQEHCLALMAAAPEGEVKKSDIAYLTDRVRVNKGLPQVYGTQFFRSAQMTAFEPRPVENPEGVNVRRKQMGIEETLAENTERMNNR